VVEVLEVTVTVAVAVAVLCTIELITPYRTAYTLSLSEVELQVIA
jgi:hypothetical protein